MNRLQKKCFIVSASLHGLLLVVLVFGSALSWSREKPIPPGIKIFDPKLVTDALSSGGSPTAQAAPAPPAAPPAPAAPTPTPQIIEVPKPPTPVAREVPPMPKPVIPVKPAPKPMPVLTKSEPPKPEKLPKSTLTADELKALQNPNVKPPKETAQEAKAREDAARAKEYAVNQQRIGKAVGTSLKTLGKELSAPTEIKLPSGPGGDGPAAVNYRDLVGSKYKAAWSPPVELSDEVATVTASVTIDRDGHVMGARITKHSGNAAMDRSIQTTLDNVRDFEPFPVGSKDQQRTYEILFDLKAKRSLG